MRKIPRVMSTQHPDNITTPFFSDSDVLAGEAEVKEAFFVFSQLGATEQMWDSEGKEADNQVVEKLLSRHTDYFSKNRLGRDLYLTYRVPNPSIEKEQGKILLETLHSIPRAFDVAKATGSDCAPIFEVILPMTTTHLEIDRIKNYYEQAIVGQENLKLGKEKISVRQWVGDFEPEQINVIPLFEDRDSILGAHQIVSKYLDGKDLEYQRVFIARSDPALNYGSASAVLLAKIALQRFAKVEEQTSVEIHPIIGVGGAPFRGNFTPNNANNCTDEYPSVQTFTAQSSFKYDHPFRDVVNAIDMVSHIHKRAPLQIDEKEATLMIEKITDTYQKQLMLMADTINAISAYVPGKRARKLHTGLFGYSRSLNGIKLPRAIKFCSAFYSIGLPPELLGLSSLLEKDWDKLHDLYRNIDDDLKEASRWLNRKNLSAMPKVVKEGVEKVMKLIEVEEDEEHNEITSRIFSKYKSGTLSHLSEDIKAAAWKRRFLG